MPHASPIDLVTESLSHYAIPELKRVESGMRDAAVRSIGTAHTAHRWVSVNGYARMEFYMTASVSTVEAGGVVATETFSTTLSAISFFSSQTNDVESVDIEGGGK